MNKNLSLFFACVLMLSGYVHSQTTAVAVEHPPVEMPFVEGVEGFRAPVAVTEKLGFTEGPVWMPELQGVVFSDLHGSCLYFWSEAEGLELFRENSEKGNGNFLDLEGRVITCEGKTKRVTRLEADGSVTILAKEFEGLDFNNPNDVTVGQDGSVFFTDPNFGRSDREERQFVYRIRPDGVVEKALPDSFNKPNGILMSADGQTLYLNEGMSDRIWAYAVNADGGVENTSTPLIEGVDHVLDGLTEDPITGELYVAVFTTHDQKPDEQGIEVYSKQGEFKGRISVPGNTTNCCFDSMGENLYVTSGGRLYKLERMRVAPEL
ncbi:SMP-30/gluconolactonase/LRE family protein [Kiritimatiellota bacterium B12222]|nr:SMP-30/gluconolactonase/LRE family protein [Kiritimatiellota bacterium B12222]